MAPSYLSCFCSFDFWKRVCNGAASNCSGALGGRHPTSSWDCLNCCISCVCASRAFSSASDFCFISFLKSSETKSLLSISFFKRDSNSATKFLRFSISFSFDSDSSVYWTWDSCSFFSRVATSSLKSLVAPAIKSDICKINLVLVFRQYV